MHFEDRGNSVEKKSLKKYSSLYIVLKGPQLERIGSRRLDEHRRSLSPGTNSAAALCNASHSGGISICERESFFCHGQSKLEGTMVNREPPQTMKLIAVK